MTNRFHLNLDSWGTRLVAIAMFAFLATNTWHFIAQFIPDDTWYHRPAMFVFFEGGLLYWFNRLEHASENVGKTLIAAFMTLVQLAAVGFATLYELSVSFQQMMGLHMDTTIQFAMPFVVSGLIIIWIIAWALGRLVNQHFGARMAFIAKTGIAPHLAGVDLDPLYDTRTLPPLTLRGGPSTEPLALPAPRNVQRAQMGVARPGLLQRGFAALSNWVNRSQGDAQTVAPDASQQAVSVTEEQADSVQQSPQSPPQAQQQNAGPEPLSDLDKQMLDAFMNADSSTQQAIQTYAAAHTLAELAIFMRQAYPQYESFFTTDRVGRVMAAWSDAQVAAAAHAQQQQQAAQASSRGQMQQSSAPRTSAPRARRSSTNASSAKRGSNWQVILPLLDKEHPGLSDADLAKFAGCSASTVSRWRSAQRATV